jgi:thiol-disulfide isomerase/thioredoxin
MNSCKRLLAGSLLVLAVAIALGCAETTRSQDTAAKTGGDAKGDDALEGKPAADFEGDFALNGKPARLSSLRGKVVIVDFWAVWCLPCIEALPHMQALQDKYRDDGVVVVGVTAYNYEQGRNYGFDKKNGKLRNLDEGNKQTEQVMLRDFAQYHKMEYLVMTLPKAEFVKAAEAYRVKYIPTVVVIDQEGVIRHVAVGGGRENVQEVEAAVKKLVGKK